MKYGIIILLFFLTACSGVQKKNNVHTIDMPVGLNLTVNDLVAAYSAHLPLLEKGTSKEELLAAVSDEDRKNIVENSDDRIVFYTKMTTDKNATNDGMRYYVYRFEDGRLVEGPKVKGDMNHIKWRREK